MKIKAWLSYFKSTTYITRTAILTALLFVVGLITAFFKFGNSSFQIVDGFYFALTAVIPGPMMLVVGILYPTFFDLVNGGFIFIPISILIHVLMFIFIKLLKKPITGYGAISISGLFLFIYVWYGYLINLNLGIDTARSIALQELVIDAIQFGVSLFIGIFFYFVLSRPNLKRIFTN